LGFPFNISETTEGSDFKIGKRVGFAKAHQKITPRRKSGSGHELGELRKILGFPFNISATAEASDFKFDIQLGFAKAHHNIKPRGKSGCGPGRREFRKIWGSPLIFNEYASAHTRVTNECTSLASVSQG